jgi:hypothetical protein
MFEAPDLTPGRVRAAYAVAVIADAIQLFLGPAGWIGSDQALDVAAAVATSWLIGFHPLLLPTFVVEFLPVSDLLPTWTGCVALVIALRKRSQRLPTVQPSKGSVIDV